MSIFPILDFVNEICYNKKIEKAVESCEYADYYGASVYKAPFDSSTVGDINRWIEEKTDGLINQVVGGSIRKLSCCLSMRLFLRRNGRIFIRKIKSQTGYSQTGTDKSALLR